MRCTGLILVVSIGSCFSLADTNPYGICAHVSRRGEHELARQEYALMRAAGIGWVRTDFDWSSMQHEAGGEWTFDLFDETVKQAQEAGIKILPILDYDVPWARPAYKHRDAWLAYVRAIVTRYKDRLRHWEVWNEPNLKQFWREDPDPANYTTLLKATYLEIKRIDPQLQVLFGGTAEIPIDFIEGAYKAGAADFFDIMNVHPYGYPDPPEQKSLYEDLVRLRQLMARFGDGDKPIWITEIGWPTHRPSVRLLTDVVKTGLHVISPQRKQWTLAVLDDPGYPVPNPFDEQTLREMLPSEGAIEPITLEGMQDLDPQKQPALLLPPEEAFPADYFDAIERYVKQGGILILGKGVPLYYTVKRAPDGRWERAHAEDSYRRRLHIGWEAWWTRKGVPETVTKINVPSSFTSMIQTPEKAEATRFLTDSQLQSGDQIIPLLTASKDNYTGVAAAAYRLNSNLKGGLIVSTPGPDFRGILPDRQAYILPRAYLLAFQAGVEAMFWYNLRARENDPYYNEDHFGIIHKDLTPKPAYPAMQALTRARPAGSKTGRHPHWRRDGIFCMGWVRPDGQAGWALWDGESQRKLHFNVTGPITQAWDHLGKTVLLSSRQGQIEVSLGPGPVYLIGPTQLTPIASEH